MHFVGMAGYAVPATMTWDPVYVSASVVLGAVLGAASIAAMRDIQGLSGRIAGAGLFALGICAMQFTGMAAVTLAPDSRITVPDSIIAPEALVIVVAVVTVTIMAFGLAGFVIDQRFARRSEDEAARLRGHVDALERTKPVLASATLQIKAALSDAEQVNRAKSGFLATMSHEVRTRTNGILGMASVLIATDLEPRVREGVTISSNPARP